MNPLDRWSPGGPCKGTAAARAAEDAKWKPLSMSTDYPGMGDFADSEVAQTLMQKKP